MRLTDGEFRAMNSAPRRLLQRCVEFPLFRLLGLRGRNRDVLEIGCGSGYGATLLARLRPKSYVGIDLMPEQIDLARRRCLPNSEFLVMDASDLGSIPAGCKDVVVVFGILHHVSRWREVLAECHRVLRKGGRLFLEEPGGAAVRLWDKLVKWNHPEQALFGLHELESQLQTSGFRIARKIALFPFGFYCAEKT
jgi:SAM-dependent methyltransferase